MNLTHPDSKQTVEVEEAHTAPYFQQGWRSAEAPAGNASLAQWQDYARQQGLPDEAIEGKSRSELRNALG